jgi:hypothetical protein
MQKMEKFGVFISTLPEPATPLQSSLQIGEGDAGYLARVTHTSRKLRLPNKGG